MDKQRQQTMMTWHVNRCAMSRQQQCMLSLPTILIKVRSVPPLPLFISHMRSRGHVTVGDIATKNLTTHQQMTMIHRQTTATTWDVAHRQTVMTHIVVAVHIS